MPFPIDSFGDAFLAGEVIRFIEDHTKTCRRCGRDSFYGEKDYEHEDRGDYLCPRCWDAYDEDDGYEDFD